MTQRSDVSKFLRALGRNYPESMFTTSWRVFHATSKRTLLEGSWLALSRQGGEDAAPIYRLLIPDSKRDGIWIGNISATAPSCRQEALVFDNFILVMERPQDLKARKQLLESVRRIQFHRGEGVKATLPHRVVKNAVQIRALKELTAPSPKAAGKAPHAPTPPAKSRRTRLQQAQMAVSPSTPAAATAPSSSSLAKLHTGGDSFLEEMEQAGSRFVPPPERRSLLRRVVRRSTDFAPRRYGDFAPRSKLASLTTGSPGMLPARSKLAGAPLDGMSPLWRPLRAHEGPLPSKSTPFSQGVRGLGLRNLGNTCYMNAVLQALAACTPFRRDLFSSVWPEVFREEAAVASGDAAGSPLRYHVPRERAHVHNALIQVFRQLMRRDRPGDGIDAGAGRVAADPGAVRRAIAHKRDAFSSFRQQDAHEFLIELLDVLSEEDLPRSRRACAVVLRHTQHSQAALTPAAEACIAASDWVMDEGADVFPSADHVAMVMAGMPAEDAARAVCVSPARSSHESGAAASPAPAPTAVREGGSACAGDVVDVTTPASPGRQSRKRPRAGSGGEDEVSPVAAGNGAAPHSPDAASGSAATAGERDPGPVQTPARDSPDKGANEGYIAVDDDAPVDEAKLARLQRACDAAMAVMPASRCFRGMVQTLVQCAGCGHKRSSATAYHALSLYRPASYVEKGSAGAHVGVKALCDSFFSDGSMEAQCPACGHGAATHRLRLQCLPRILVLHVKRFNVDLGSDGEARLSKDCTEVEAPPELDVAPWCAEECWVGPSGPLGADVKSEESAPPAPAVKAEKGASGPCLKQWRTGEAVPSGHGTRYRLKSIVHHHGSEAFFGHYTASVLQSVPAGQGKGEKQWVEFNDSSSRVVAGGKFEWMMYAERPDVRRSSYLYLYEREA